MNNDSVNVCFKYFSLVRLVDSQLSVEINSHEKLLLLTQFICMKVFLVVYFLWYFSLPFITLILLSTSTHPMGMIFYKIYVFGCFKKYNVFYYTVAHSIVPVETYFMEQRQMKSTNLRDVPRLMLFTQSVSVTWVFTYPSFQCPQPFMYFLEGDGMCIAKPHTLRLLFQ